MNATRHASIPTVQRRVHRWMWHVHRKSPGGGQKTGKHLGLATSQRSARYRNIAVQRGQSNFFGSCRQFELLIGKMNKL